MSWGLCNIATGNFDIRTGWCAIPPASFMPPAIATRWGSWTLRSRASSILTSASFAKSKVFERTHPFGRCMPLWKTRSVA
jgi:hypothetical protein